VADAVAERSRSVRWQPVAAGALTLALAWTFVAMRTDGRPGSVPKPGTPLAVNRPAPSFTSPLLGGNGAFALGAQRGHVVVVNFWASWCRPCRLEAPTLAALARSYADRGVRFIGVNYEDPPKFALAAARRFALPYPSVTDPHGSLGEAFDIVGLPTTVVIGADGRIRYFVTGRVQAGSFRTALDTVLRAAPS
jgi:cytochrome c biogenesis protein CcmG/thiol:disulfide interchange protein DsbE